MLVDLHQLVRPTISIVDGIIAMEGNGPGSGPPKPLGIVVAGADSFSVDRVIAEVVGTEPDLITTLDVAKGNGYGVIDMAGIEVVGETIDDVRVGDFTFPPSTARPQKMLQVMSFLLRDSVTERPVINKETCRSCEQCAQACPMECITQLEEGFEIDTKRCIQCYCCIEVCPEGAVELKLGRYLRAYEALRQGQRALRGLFRK
jgi:Pyruvate/2-oxoacid:ferredoxin oxidoreductase delta subunit